MELLYIYLMAPLDHVLCLTLHPLVRMSQTGQGGREGPGGGEGVIDGGGKIMNEGGRERE